MKVKSINVIDIVVDNDLIEQIVMNAGETRITNQLITSIEYVLAQAEDKYQIKALEAAIRHLKDAIKALNKAGFP